MSYPKSDSEWWKLLEDNHDKLLNLVRDYHPGSPHAGSSKRMPITAGGAEAQRRVFRTQIEMAELREAQASAPAARFQVAVSSKDAGTVVLLLNETWFGIPESRDAHGLPGFGALCDLCSECGCVLPEPDQEAAGAA